LFAKLFPAPGAFGWIACSAALLIERAGASGCALFDVGAGAGGVALSGQCVEALTPTVDR